MGGRNILDIYCGVRKHVLPLKTEFMDWIIQIIVDIFSFSLSSDLNVVSCELGLASLIGLSAASAAFSGAASMGVSAVKNKKSYKYTKKLLADQDVYRKLALEDSKAFWREQANYEAPVNEVARLRAAGLSPLSDFSGSGSPGLSSVSGVDASQFQADGARLPPMDLAELAMQKQSVDANVELLNAEARLKRSQAVDQEWKNTLQPQYERQLDAIVGAAESDEAKKAIEAAWLPFQNSMQMALSSADLALKKEGLNKYLAEIDELKSRKLLNDADAERAKEAARNLAALTQTENDSREWKVENLQRDVQKKAAETAFTWYQKEVLGPEKRYNLSVNSYEARQRAKKVDFEIERLAKENKYTDAQIEYLKYLRRIGWAKFGVSTALGVSAEARSWFKNGSKAGQASNWNIDEDALGAIAATL